MYLPVSKGYTAMLVVVDLFSKGFWFIPSCSPPMVMQIAEALFCIL